MAVLRARRNRRKRKGITRRKVADVRATAETDFKGPNVKKRDRNLTKFTATLLSLIPRAKNSRRGCARSVHRSFVDEQIIGG